MWNTDAIFGKDNRAEFAFFLQRNNRHLVGFDRDILPDFAKNRRGNVDIVGPVQQQTATPVIQLEYRSRVDSLQVWLERRRHYSVD